MSEPATLEAPPVTPPATPAAPSTLLSGTPATPATPGDVTPATGWKESLPDIFRSDPSLKVFEGHADQATMLEALGKAYRDTKSMVGRKMEAPGPDATPEQVAAFRKVTGAPETPEGYGSLRPEEFPAELWDAESEKQFAALAHKHHLSPAAVKEIAALHGTMMQGGLEASSAAQEQLLAAEGDKLRQAWGSQFDANLAVAQRFAATIGLKPDNPIFTSSEVVQALARGASLLSEDKLVPGSSTAMPAGNQARAQAIMDPKSTDMLARQYRGEFGQEQQMAAQQTLNLLLQS